jgi:tetratricopeptide (TPR) repeat protein
MKIKLILFGTVFLVSAKSFPCGNAYHRSSNMEEYASGSKLEYFRFNQQFNYSLLVEELNKLSDAINADLNLFENENDKALAYMRMGKIDEAINILERLEKEKPGEYNVIANLGTAYELKGENEKALRYITKAVSINAASHRGSEWFHIKILEAKLLNKNESWWTTHPVLNLATVKKDPEIIISDIIYQLKERLPFTKKPDLMMAAVLHETGDFLIKNNKQEQAWIIFKIGVEYDRSNTLGLDKKVQTLEKYFTKNNIPVPDYTSHFVKTENIVETGKNLLEKGYDIFTKHQDKVREREKAERRQRTILYAAASGAVILLAFILYYKQRRKRAS